MEAIEKFFNGVRDFVITQGKNPWFWIIVFFAGVGLFFVVYNALHRN